MRIKFVSCFLALLFFSAESLAFHSEYFGMTVQLPSSWHSRNLTNIAPKVKELSGVIAGDNDEFEQMLKTGADQAVYIFSITKYPPGSTPKNPALSCGAEPLNDYPGISGIEFLKNMKRLMQSSALPYNFERPIYTRNIGGIAFYVLDISLNSSELGVLHQSYYTSIMKGYAFGFIKSWITTEEKEELNNILKTVTFD